MAYNWNTRRSVVSFSQKVEDSREILKQYLSRNNFNDVTAIDQLMSFKVCLILTQPLFVLKTASFYRKP